MTPASMRWTRLGAVGAMVIVALTGRAVAQGAPGDTVPAAAAIDAVRPALVRLGVVFSEFDSGREVRREASGSGFVITPEGHVLTNHHVAGRATRVRATLPDGRQLDADVIGADAMSDLAVVKLRTEHDQAFTPVRFGDSARLALGEPVLAMGSPLGLSQSVTAGLVSNLALVMPREFEIEGEDVGALVRWIGHDAPIFPGNSGGPLVNLRGEVVGVNDIGFGLGGAIPGNLAREVAEALVRDGRVRRSWLGIDLQPLLRIDVDGSGALVSGCVPGSPADAAGVRAGDVLLRVGDEPLLARTAEDLAPLNLLLSKLPVGRPIELQVRRDGRDLALRITPVDREPRRAPLAEVEALGFTGATVTASQARAMGRTSVGGVRVHAVRPGGGVEAARPALQAGDVIVSIDNVPTADLDALRAQVEAAPAAPSRARSFLVSFERGQDRFVTLVRAGPRRQADRSTEAARAWLAVNTQPLEPELADRLGMPGAKGVLVTRVYPGSSAEAAGVRAGDVVVGFDGEPVMASAGGGDALAALARARRIGAVVAVDVLRDGATKALSVALEAAPTSARDAARHRDDWLEFSAREVVQQDEGPGGGVKVDEVTEGGWAALARLRVGDVILAVNGTSTADIAAFSRAMAEAARAAHEPVVLLVRRGDTTRFIEVRPTRPTRTTP